MKSYLGKLAHCYCSYHYPDDVWTDRGIMAYSIPLIGLARCCLVRTLLLFDEDFTSGKIILASRRDKCIKLVGFLYFISVFHLHPSSYVTMPSGIGFEFESRHHDSYVLRHINSRCHQWTRQCIPSIYVKCRYLIMWSMQTRLIPKSPEYI